MKKKINKSSYLPPDVTNEILSRMPIRDAVRTSVLSPNWRCTWSTIPDLVFDKNFLYNYSEGQIIKMVSNVLLLHNGPINKFEFSFDRIQDYTHIDRWISYLSRKYIKEFTLRAVWVRERYKVPSSLFSCETLIYLELHNCLLISPSTFVGFKYLKSLDLWHITMGQNVFESLITGCPMLERLTLVSIDGFKQLNVDAPKLQFLYASGNFNDVRFQNSFHLASVSIYPRNSVEEMEPPRSSNKLLTFFASLPHIQRLTIGWRFLKFLAVGNVPSCLPSPCVDLNYLHIELNFDDLDDSLVVSCLLRSSPNLQVLKISVSKQEDDRMNTQVGFWNTGEHWNCIFTELRVVKIELMQGKRSEMDFIELILSNSPVLKTMTVNCELVTYDNEDERSKVLNELMSFQRASMAAKIIFS